MNFNNNAKQIIIPTSKGKIFLLFIGSAVFVAVGLWFIISPSTFEHSGISYRPDWETQSIGYVTIAFCGACFIGSIFMFFSDRPGLIINDYGIIIGSKYLKNVIKWDTIERFDIKYISNTRLIQVYIKNSEEYIRHQENGYKRKLLQFNYKKYGALMSISTNTLKCDFNELYQFLTNRLNEYKAAKKETKPTD